MKAADLPDRPGRSVRLPGLSDMGEAEENQVAIWRRRKVWQYRHHRAIHSFHEVGMYQSDSRSPPVGRDAR